MRRPDAGLIRTAIATVALLGVALQAAAQNPSPACPTPSQGYEIAGCFIDGNGNEYPSGGTVDVHDLAFGEAFSSTFPAGTFVVDAFLVAPPSTPPASCSVCGPVDFCVVVDFNASPAGQPASQTHCAAGDPTVNDGGFDLRSLNGGVPLVATIPVYTVGGSVSGLTGDGLILQNNGQDDLPVSGDGVFTFPTALRDGSSYDVTVASQPSDITLECAVADGSGELSGADILDVRVTCETRAADLSITKTDGFESIAAGEPVTYAITVANAGPENVLGARVIDMLPLELSGATWSCTPAAGAGCPTSGEGDIDAVIDLPAGRSVIFVLTATTSTDIEAEVVNEAEVIAPADVVDPNPANNVDTDRSNLNGVFQDGFERPGAQLLRLLEE